MPQCLVNICRCIVCFFAIALHGFGNPIPMGEWAYINSELLSVDLQKDHAAIEGKFTFRSTAAKGPMDVNVTGAIQIPIWIPEPKHATGQLRKFLELCSEEGRYEIAGELAVLWGNVFDLKVKTRRADLKPASFTVITGGGRTERSSPRSGLYRKSYCVVMAVISLPREAIQNDAEVVISYRQPLFEGRDEMEFYYMAILGAGPKMNGVRSGTFDMVITNRAGVDASLGGAVIPSGRSATLPLADGSTVAVRLSRNQ